MQRLDAGATTLLTTCSLRDPIDPARTSCHDRSRQGGMDLEQWRDRIGWAAPQATFGRQTEAVAVPARRRDSANRSFDTVRKMHQAEIELRLRPESQRRKRQIIVIIESLARDWKMHPIQRTLQSRCDLVGKSHELPCILGLL